MVASWFNKNLPSLIGYFIWVVFLRLSYRSIVDLVDTFCRNSNIFHFLLDTRKRHFVEYTLRYGKCL